MPPPAPVTRARRVGVMLAPSSLADQVLCSCMPLQARSCSVRPGGEARRALFEVCGESLADLGATETDELQAERGLERRYRAAVPVVQAVLRPLDGGRRTVGELPGDALGFGHDVLVVDALGHQPDALGLLTGERVARQQVVLRLGHADEQRPAD